MNLGFIADHGKTAACVMSDWRVIVVEHVMTAEMAIVSRVILSESR